MKNYLKLFSLYVLLITSCILNAACLTTARTAQFSNNKVSVWETVIYPNEKQILKMQSAQHDQLNVLQQKIEGLAGRVGGVEQQIQALVDRLSFDR